MTRQSLQDVLTGLRSSGFVAQIRSTTRGRASSLELTSAGASGWPQPMPR